MDAGSPRRRQLVHVLGRPPGADQAEQYLRALQYAAPAPRPSLPRSATASAPDWLMHRDIALEGPMMLELSVFYVNGIDEAQRLQRSIHRARTAGARRGAKSAISYRHPVAGRGHDSMDAADIRATVFQTAADDPARRGPALIRYDLSAWARADRATRIATARTAGCTCAGIDVRLIPIER